ncbi:hypothetical protein CEXT_391901 [Caerostris extrusa]|uniref:Uncharacterized protein n=1 Tax=Caerostris extrusa TaxID=172846 RepID=A0AAV4WDG6_CAEEX|nr:hypothetical protein CEXT_391901 [Caerostris extrusa]
MPSSNKKKDRKLNYSPEISLLLRIDLFSSHNSFSVKNANPSFFHLAIEFTSNKNTSLYVENFGYHKTSDCTALNGKANSFSTGYCFPLSVGEIPTAKVLFVRGWLHSGYETGEKSK